MADSKQIEITLTLKDEASKRITSTRAAIKEFSTETKNSLKPILQLRQAWSKAGLAIGFTTGAFVAGYTQLKNLREEFEEMDRTAIKLGITTEELSNKIYGFNLATKEARTGANWSYLLDYGLKTVQKVSVGKTAETVGWVSQFNAARSLITSDIKEKSQDGMFGGMFNPSGWIDLFKKGPKKAWQEAWQTAGDQFEGIAAGIKAGSEEALKLNVELTSKSKQLTLSQFEYTKYQLRQEVELAKISGSDKQLLYEYEAAAVKRLEEDKTTELKKQQSARLKSEGDTIKALMLEQEIAAEQYKRVWGPDSEVTKAFLNGQAMQLQEARLSVLGIRSENKIMEESWKNSVQNMKTCFGNILYSGVRNQFSDLEDVVASFGDSILQILTQAAAEALITKAALGLLGWGVGGIMGGIGGSIIDTGSQSIAGHAFTSAWSPFHSGGVIRAHSGYLASDEVPIIAQSGEGVISRKGMSVLGSDNLKRLNRGEDIGGNTQIVNLNINAVDSKSFVDLMNKHPEVVQNIVARAVSGNKNLRHTLRNKL